jgi:hypothetical protein
MPSVEGVGGVVVVSRGFKLTKALVAVSLIILDWLVNVSRIRLRERWPLTKPVNRRKIRITYGASILRNHTVPP